MENNSNGFQINVYSSGNQIAQTINNTYHGNVNYGKSNSERPQYTDEQIAKALTAINGAGKAVDSKQKWAGVYWYLRWACNFPLTSNAFCEKVNALPGHEDWAYECSNNNIRLLTTLSFMESDPRQMEKVTYSKNDTSIFFQCRQVALALEEELKKTII